MAGSGRMPVTCVQRPEWGLVKGAHRTVMQAWGWRAGVKAASPLHPQEAGREGCAAQSPGFSWVHSVCWGPVPRPAQPLLPEPHRPPGLRHSSLPQPQGVKGGSFALKINSFFTLSVEVKFTQHEIHILTCTIQWHLVHS